MTTWAPDALFALIVNGFTIGFFVALRRIRRAIARNLDPVLGPCGPWERERRIFRTMNSFAWCYAERYLHLHSPQRFDIEVEAGERLEAIPRSEGILFVTAHIGHWETASYLMPSGVERAAHVVREEELDPRSQAYMRRLLERHGRAAYKTHFAGDNPALAVELARVLRQGHAVALQGDRPRTGGRSLSATIFGRPMPLPVGPAALARAAGVPLIPVFTFRTGPCRYRVCVRERIEVRTDGDRDSAIREAIDRLAREIEWAISREPHQWYCFRDLWPRERGPAP